MCFGCFSDMFKQHQRNKELKRLNKLKQREEEKREHIKRLKELELKLQRRKNGLEFLQIDFNKYKEDLEQEKKDKKTLRS